MNCLGYDSNKNSSWIKMLLTVLILTSFLSDIQARFDNEVEPILHDVYKRSPRRVVRFDYPRNKRKPCCLLSSLSSTKSKTSNVCAGTSVDECESQHPQDIKQCKVCGLINSNSQIPIVIDGSVVDPPFKYPWHVALIKRKMIICGAAIISDSYVLTAGHCVLGTGEGGFSHPNEVSLGFVTKTRDVALGPPVEKVIPHPEYSEFIGKYDVALLKLKEKITCGKYRNPICLPSPDLNINMNAVLRYTGWGTTVGERPHKQPESLMEGSANLVNFEECNKKGKEELEGASYCLVGRASSRPCFGDSGGSMAYLHKKKFYTIGVASQTTCTKCSTGQPFVYASIPKVVEWIEKITRS